MNYYLIDYENVKADGIKNLKDITERDSIILFYSEQCKNISLDVIDSIMKLNLSFSSFKASVGTKNALDFQLSSYLGYLIGQHGYSDSRYYIVSKDKGYDCLCTYWKGMGAEVKRITFSPETATKKSSGKSATKNGGKNASHSVSKAASKADAKAVVAADAPAANVSAADIPTSNVPAADIPSEADDIMLSPVFAAEEASAPAALPLPVSASEETSSADAESVSDLNQETSKPVGSGQPEQTPKASKAKVSGQPKQAPKAPKSKSSKVKASDMATLKDMQKLLDEEDSPEEVLEIFNQYKTKVAINNGLSKKYKDSKRASMIYKKLKPLLKEKNKS